jgi:uncharacterized protein (DUF1800 family)
VPSNPDDIAHLLRRSGFVAPGARIQQLAALDWPNAVEAVLDRSANPGDDVPGHLNSWDPGNGYELYVQLVHWWLDRCAATPTPLVEKMTLFWHGHFTTSFSKAYHLPAILSQHRLYRTHALGDFSSLAQAMAVEPAMLWYLDNADNTARSPNQNFARELMELFLLGVGNYTEDDVVAAARAWTGHTTPEWNVAEYVFRADRHDYGDKSFFGTTRNWDGPDIITEILTNPAKRPTVARFISRKLWEFFAYQNPSNSIVDGIAQAFLDAGLNITAALRALFNRPEFVSTQAKQGLVRSPIEYVVASLFHTGLRSAEAHPEWWLEDMGQGVFNPPNVSGWRPNAYWVNSSALTGRAEFARYLSWQLRERGWWTDLDSRAVGDAIDHGAATFGLTLSATTRTALVNWLAGQRSSSQRWAERTNISTLLLLAPEMNLA